MDLGAVVERTILDYAAIPYAYEPNVSQVPVFDTERGHYLLVVTGWGAAGERVHYTLIHVAIRADLIWIEHDGTEEGIAADLERAGIDKDRIVLAFHPPDARAHSGYAVAR